MQESMPSPPAETPRPGEPTRPSADRPAIDDPRALQILSTEHWSLLTTRSLAYNESFSRAGMFLTFLSATLIVVGFLIGTQGLSGSIIPVVAILLLADLYIGARDRRSAGRGEPRGAARGPRDEPDPARLPRDGARP